MGAGATIRCGSVLERGGRKWERGGARHMLMSGVPQRELKRRSFDLYSWFDLEEWFGNWILFLKHVSSSENHFVCAPIAIVLLLSLHEKITSPSSRNVTSFSVPHTPSNCRSIVRERAHSSAKSKESEWGTPASLFQNFSFPFGIFVNIIRVSYRLPERKAMLD